MSLRQPAKISTRLLIITGVFFLIIGAIFIALTNYQMKQQALSEARDKANIMLDRNLSTHTYFSHQLKPQLFKITDPILPKGYFDPVWMSSTYAIREINKYFLALNPSGYYYKECALNARSPENEADLDEKQFLAELNKDPDLKIRSEIRYIGGKASYVVLRRGETMEASCLRCHSTPEASPEDLVKIYGAEKSFHRNEGDIISAISIRIPLSEAYQNSNLISAELGALLLALLTGLYLFQFWITKRLVFKPLSNIHRKSIELSLSDEYLGEAIPLPKGRELRELTEAFNKMSRSLKQHQDDMEKIIEKRTQKLTDAIVRLNHEIEERKITEKRLLIQKRQLETALSEVKTLSGFVTHLCFVQKNSG